MFDLGPPYPCVGILGPKDLVPWTDALVGFVCFYHLTLTKDLRIIDAVATMNQAAGTDVFEVRQVPNLPSLMGPAGLEMARRYEAERNRGGTTVA